MRARLLAGPLLLVLLSLGATRTAQLDGLESPAVAELQSGRLVVSGLPRRLEGKGLRAWALPADCSGQAPVACRAAALLDYELTYSPSAGWVLTISALPSCVRSVSLWRGSSGAQAPLSSISLRGRSLECPSPPGDAHPSVAVVLEGGHTATARRLQQTTNVCSLTLGGATRTYDACPPATSAPFDCQLFYSLSAAASGGTLFRGGIKAANPTGWVGWGPGADHMLGANVVIVKADASADTGASVDGYVIPQVRDSVAINAAKGSWRIYNTAAAVQDGHLVATFIASLPSNASILAASQFPYIWATGPVNSSTGNIQQHIIMGFEVMNLVYNAPTVSGAPTSAPAPAPAPAPTPSAAKPVSSPALAPAPAKVAPAPAPASASKTAPAPAPAGNPPSLKPAAGPIAAPAPAPATAPACSLTVAGKAFTFDACPPASVTNTNYQIFYSLTPAAAGGTLFRGGIRVPNPTGWAGWGLGAERMFGAKAAVVRANASSSTGASVEGYVLPQAASMPLVNAARGSWPLLNTSAAVSNGYLVATFVANLPSSVATLTASPFPYIWAVGPLSTKGDMQTHEDYNWEEMTLVGPATTMPAPASAPGAAKPKLAPAPAPALAAGAPALAPAPASAPVPAPAPGPSKAVTSTASSCVLQLGPASAQGFVACTPIPNMGVPFTLHWTVLGPSSPSSHRRRLRQAASTTKILMGINGTSDGQGYLAVGFPTNPGRMIGASAFVLQDCTSCSSGAQIQGFYLASQTPSGVKPPARLAATNLTAARTAINGSNWLSGSFVVEVDSSLVASPTANLLFAVGGLLSSGSPAQHDVYAAGNVPLQPGTGQGGNGNTSVSGFSSGTTSASKRAAHGWLMAISWGVLIPSGIVMARCFKELDPLWFHVHRIVQSLGFVLGIAGFGVGFSIRGTWATPYPEHRNMGVAVMTLGLVQVTALLWRPATDAPLRRYWNPIHWYIGRAAALLAIVNIYYGIIHVDKLGTWAWATYTAVLGLIVAVAVVKDIIDYRQGVRSFKPWETTSPQGTPAAKKKTGSQFMTSPKGTPKSTPRASSALPARSNLRL